MLAAGLRSQYGHKKACVGSAGAGFVQAGNTVPGRQVIWRNAS